MKQGLLAAGAIVALALGAAPAHAEWFQTGYDVSVACSITHMRGSDDPTACYAYITGVVQMAALDDDTARPSGVFPRPRVCMPAKERIDHVVIDGVTRLLKEPSLQKESAPAAVEDALMEAHPCP